MKTVWNELPRPFFVLAPMEGVTDNVFRRVVSEAAAPDIYFTEFVNAASFCSPKGIHSTRGRLATEDPIAAAGGQPVPKVPLVAQIWGTRPEQFAQMGRALADMGYDGIDINMGCPVKDVIKTGACSALINNPPLAAELIAAAKESGLPVSVKTRIGFTTPVIEEWIGHLLRQDLAALTVHARTQREMSKVPAHHEAFAQVIALRDAIAPQTPVIGNGDIMDRQHGETLAAQYGLDGVMIGRGIFTNPFCFSTAPGQHDRKELLALLRSHLDAFDAAGRVQPRKFDPLKRFFKIYIRNFDGASELRERLMSAKSTTEVRHIIDISA
ncbi:tRNA-dihydrouridine synthase [Candidatus Saccharibacteria bacterium]|nr:tRNA-dihydrouridine synthase [Candidatus Saccharibacteria bacterium]